MENTQPYSGTSTTGGGFLDSLGNQAINILGDWAKTKNQIKLFDAQQNTMQPLGGAPITVSQQGLGISPGLLIMIGVGVVALLMLKD